MPHSIPVFFLPVREELVPALSNASAAEEAIAAAADDPATSGMKVARSTNWWFNVLTLSLCDAWSIRGLEFLRAELRILSVAEVAGAAQATSRLLANLASLPLPTLQKTPECVALEAADRALLASTQPPAFEIADQGADGDAQAFFRFLAMLAGLADGAQKAGRQLLFYAPQP
jgi:hypothetical protein